MSLASQDGLPHYDQNKTDVHFDASEYEAEDQDSDFEAEHEVSENDTGIENSDYRPEDEGLPGENQTTRESFQNDHTSSENSQIGYYQSEYPQNLYPPSDYAPTEYPESDYAQLEGPESEYTSLEGPPRDVASSEDVSNDKLPTKEKFFNDLDSECERWCSICFGAFDETDHCVTRVRGASGCRHIFGWRCITTWANGNGPGNPNTCPRCRGTMFRKPDESERISEEEGDDQNQEPSSSEKDTNEDPTFQNTDQYKDPENIWAEGITTREEGEALTKLLWSNLWQLSHDDPISETDIETKINETLHTIGRKFDHRCGLYLMQKNWPKVLAMAKQMIREQRRHNDSTALTSQKSLPLWWLKLNIIFSWVVRKDFAEQSNRNDQIGNTEGMSSIS